MGHYIRNFLLVLLVCWTPAAHAQELEARTYANAPVGVNFAGVALGYSTGNIIVDASLPIESLDSDVLVAGHSYTRTLGVFGVGGKLKVQLPYVSGDWEGDLGDGTHRERSVDGFGDARVIFEVNFFGAPALQPKEFAGYRQKTIVGASFLVSMPTGKYEEEKLINISSNRWAFRPQVGVSRAVGSWDFEAMVSAWFFEDNDDFFGGSTLEQDSIYALQAHAIYNIRRGCWVGVGVAYARGGKTTLDGVRRDDSQSNTRAGTRLVYPLSRRQGMAAEFSTSLSTRNGGDYDNYKLSYQIMWGERG